MREALAVLFLLSLPLEAAREQSASKPDLKLTVRARNGQSVFHVGEVIPLELSFTSTTPKAYQIDMASYDRSGRLGEEHFAVEPETGWDDPLALYFHSFYGFMGGGIRGSRVLSDQPTVVNEELNEWVRFREPGEYRLAVTSHRVSRITDSRSMEGATVSGNELLLTIIPATKDWQRQELQRALSMLNGADRRSDGCKILRYLGTAEAAREMARRLNDRACETDCYFGLISSAAHDEAFEEMRRLLRDSDYGVSSQFVMALSMLSLPEDASGDIPEQREKAESEFLAELSAALSTKRGPALALSVNTIVEGAGAHSKDLPAELKQSLSAHLVATFDQLPISKQAELLESRWKVLDHQAMLPLLKQVAQRYQDFSELREMNAWEFNKASAAALQHWYELDPDGARPAILREISRARARFDARVLGILPDKELPEVEQALAEHLNQLEEYDGLSNVASLIYRYASGGVEAPVSSYMDERLGKMACAIQEPLLAYLLKVDPVGARPRLEKAMDASGPGFSACNHSLLREVAKLQNDSMLEEIAIRALDNSDPQVVGDAAAYLGEYGSAAAEPVLWSHLVAWNQRWAGHEGDMRSLPGEPVKPAVFQSGAGMNLLQALACGPGWLADEAKLRRLIQLAVGDQQKQQADGYLRAWESRPWTISFIPLEKGQFEIGQCHSNSLAAAKEKIKQFPAGTSFQWSGDSRQDGEDKAFQELSQFAASQGMSITRP